MTGTPIETAIIGGGVGGLTTGLLLGAKTKRQEGEQTHREYRTCLAPWIPRRRRGREAHRTLLYLP